MVAWCAERSGLRAYEIGCVLGAPLIRWRREEVASCVIRSGSGAQMRRIEAYFPRLYGGLRVDDRRVLSGYLRDPQRPAVACCVRSIWPGQDDLQSRHPREPPGRIRQDRRGLLRLLRAGRETGSGDDRCPLSHGASHDGGSARKGAVPGCVGRTKGGLNATLHAVCDGKGGGATQHDTGALSVGAALRPGRFRPLCRAGPSGSPAPGPGRWRCFCRSAGRSGLPISGRCHSGAGCR